MTDQFDRAQQLEEMQREIALKKTPHFPGSKPPLL